MHRLPGAYQSVRGTSLGVELNVRLRHPRAGASSTSRNAGTSHLLVAAVAERARARACDMGQIHPNIRRSQGRDRRAYGFKPAVLAPPQAHVDLVTERRVAAVRKTAVHRLLIQFVSTAAEACSRGLGPALNSRDSEAIGNTMAMHRNVCQLQLYDFEFGIWCRRRDSNPRLSV